METLNKYQIKHLHKANGIIFEFIEVSNTTLGIVLYKAGNNKRNMYFIAYGEISEGIKKSFKLKDRISVKFTIKARKENNKWIDDLIIIDYEIWSKKDKTKPLTEQTLKEKIEDNNYARNLNANIDFLEPKTVDPNQTKMNI